MGLPDAYDWAIFLYFELLEARDRDELFGTSTIARSFEPFASDSLRRDFDAHFMHIVETDDRGRSPALSDRHRRRVFQTAVGLSPKQVERIARFQRLLGELAAVGSSEFAGFYDQAHAIREFRALAGVTPGAYLSEYRCEKA